MRYYSFQPVLSTWQHLLCIKELCLMCMLCLDSGSRASRTVAKKQQPGKVFVRREAHHSRKTNGDTHS